jgi:hypothetical protein
MSESEPSKKEYPSPTKLKDEVVSETEPPVKKYTAVPVAMSLTETGGAQS